MTNSLSGPEVWLRLFPGGALSLLIVGIVRSGGFFGGLIPPFEFAIPLVLSEGRGPIGGNSNYIQVACVSSCV